MKQFEYKIIECDKNVGKCVKHLNSLGKEGWEAYAIYYYGNNVFYLKREIKKE